MSKVFLAYFVAGLSILCAQAAWSVTPTSSAMKTILVLGDSLSDGFQLKRSEDYPALIATSCAPPAEPSATNASATGGTTEGGLERLRPI
jgi:lysophospholipase L1-like esterase